MLYSVRSRRIGPMVKPRFFDRFRSRLSRALCIVVVAVVATTFLHSFPVRAAGITYKSGSSGQGTASVTVAKPSGVIAGDLLVAVVSNNDVDVADPVATGWTAINNRTSGTYTKSWTFYRAAQSSDTSYTFSFTGGDIGAAISAYSGVDLSNPVNGSGGASSAGSTGVTASAPSVTTTVDGAMIVAAYGVMSMNMNTVTYTAGPGMTLRDNVTTGYGTSGAAIQDGVQNLSGASGAKVLSLSRIAFWTSHTIALRPKADLVLSQSGYRWFENADASGGSSQTFAWSLGDTSGTDARDMIVDSDGNVFTLGVAYNGGVSGTSDYMVSKHNSFGLLEWSTAIGGSSAENGPGGLALDSAGNIYMTGNTGSPEHSAGNTDQLLVKLNPVGVAQWAKTWGGNMKELTSGIAIDALGNIYTVGNTQSVGYSKDDYYYDQTLVKYNSSGIEQWSRVWGGTGKDDTAISVKLDSAGNIYVAGISNSDGYSHGTGLFEQTLVKYNSAGTELWAIAWGDGSGQDYAEEVLIDSSDSIYVVGYTNSAGRSNGGNDISLLKYSPTGVKLWAKTWGGTGNEQVTGAALDSAGNVYVSGATNSPNLSAGLDDQILVKFDPSGAVQWSKSFGGTLNDGFGIVYIDPSDYIYLFGMVGSSSLVAIGGGSVFNLSLLKMDSSGNLPGLSSLVNRTLAENDRSSYNHLDISAAATVRNVSEVNRILAHKDITSYMTTRNLVSPVIDVGAPLNGVARNTPTIAPSNPSTIFRLRTLLHNQDGIDATSGTLKLQYAARGADGICDAGFSGEAYADVTGSTPIAYANNPVAVDGIGLTANANDPAHLGHTVVSQQYNESNNTDVVNSIPAGQDGMWDFALRNNGAPTGTSYCFRLVNSDNSLLTSYAQIPELSTAPPPILSIDFVDAANAVLTNPTYNFSNSTVDNSSYQSTTSMLGTASQKIRVYNSLATNGWNVTLSPTDGSTALWSRSGGGASYDFNDSGVAATDSGIDADSVGGQLAVNPTSSTIASSCSTAGTSYGGSANFLEGSVSSITLMSASSLTAMNCSWDLTGVSMTQTIPKSQPSGTYTIGMTVTVVQL